jgi:hypothetical protein
MILVLTLTVVIMNSCARVFDRLADVLSVVIVEVNKHVRGL